MRAFNGGGRTWGTAIGLVVATIAALCLAAAPAGARVIYDRATHQWFGIAPPPPVPSQIAAQRATSKPPESGAPTCDNANVDTACRSLLTLHGGLVQHAENVYLFFWDPSGFSSEPGYVSDMQNWVKSVAAGDYSPGTTATAGVGNPISVIQQYYDKSGPGGTKNFVSYDVKYAGTIMDTDAYPTKDCTDSYKDFYTSGQPTVTLTDCVTQGQLIGELNKYLTAHHLPRGISTEYFILTPPNVGSCDDQTSKTCAIAQYCGWHTDLPSSTGPSGEVLYADMPWLSGTNCDVNRALTDTGTNSPNLYTSGIDPVVGVFSHELSETMTDPNPPTGWFGSGGTSDEVADKCAYQYSVGNDFYDLSGVPTTPGGAYYNTTLGGRNYLLQMEFDNWVTNAQATKGGCSQWDTQTQPSAAIAAPAHPASASPATFSLTGVSDPVGIAYTTWSFGDGATGRSTGTASISHTYGAAGARTVTAIVTDNDGNEVKETKSVTVTQGSARIAVKLSTQHPAPLGTYTVSLTGFAIPGGNLGSKHNSSEVDLFEQAAATCQATRKAEQAKVTSSGTVVRIGQWFVPAGAYAESQKRSAVKDKHATVHFCGYVSKSATVTNAKASTSYTTT
jgi:hypothetical protein